MTKYIFFLFLAVVYVFNPVEIYGQEISSFFIRHHKPKNNTQLAKYCFDITQDSNNKMILTATAYGFSYFTGKQWKSNSLSPSSGFKRFKTLVKDQIRKNTYYVGGRSECGHFTFVKDSIIYQKLISSKESKTKLGGRLNKIYQQDGKIYYLGVSTGVGIYDIGTNTMSFVKPISLANNKIFYFKNEVGIFVKLMNNRIHTSNNITLSLR